MGEGEPSAEKFGFDGVFVSEIFAGLEPGVRNSLDSARRGELVCIGEPGGNTRSPGSVAAAVVVEGAFLMVAPDRDFRGLSVAARDPATT